MNIQLQAITAPGKTSEVSLGFVLIYLFTLQANF